MEEKNIVMKDLQDLHLQYMGITLNNQDIDLMLIAGANTKDELEFALTQITNINVSLAELEFSEEYFFEVRQQIYDMYLANLTPLNDYLMNNKIEVSRKIEYLKSSGAITDDEIIILDNIIKTSGGVVDQIIAQINETFSFETVHKMYEVLREFSPIEKEGVKSYTLEASRNLLQLIKDNYNSITIDEEAKYGKIVLQDGTCEFKHLRKALDFAKNFGVEVRLNTLLFYMDCPESLYKLEKNETNKTLVKEKLIRYVDETTRFIVDAGYSDVVRSIDVFNELLNRHPLEGDMPYLYRGDISQDETLYANFDNVKAGWLKHLDIEDLCDVIAVARKNMPTMDFMYNDDHLIDPNKIPASIELIKKIQDYERAHDVKLIDSLGTQMHVDNDLTQDKINQMIVSLSQFGLPIEITEFDLAMTNDVTGLNEEQIEVLRQQKINEIYDSVEGLSGQYDIRGFTIWSKTDKQNFRVMLANKERIQKGLEPIESLHGGVFTEEMVPKGKAKIKSKFQEFNYHTHTNRCGHAGFASDREYVEAARQNGIKQLGFSDHVPSTLLEYPEVEIKKVRNEEGVVVSEELKVNEQRMNLLEVDEYISSVRTLQQENPDMNIICGFEAEFDPSKEQFLGQLRDKVDYMILGQHFLSGVSPVDNPNYPIEYAKMVCKAMESGIFDIVAHPDIFMEYRDSMSTQDDKDRFIESAKEASLMICHKACELNIPLEINFGGISKNRVMEDNELAYPHSLFWKTASSVGASVLYGVDAHDPSQFREIGHNKTKIDALLNGLTLKQVEKDYNPVEARKNNAKLQELYSLGQKNAPTFETALIGSLVGKTINSFPLEYLLDDVVYWTSLQLEKGIDAYGKEAQDKKELVVKKHNQVALDTAVSDIEKNFKLTRLENTINQLDQAFMQRQNALNRAKETLETALELGCQSRGELSNNFIQLTEAKTTSNLEKRDSLVNNIQKKKEMNNENHNQQTKAPVLVKTNKPQNNSSNKGSNGFINTLNFSLIITIVCMLGIGIGYIIYKNYIG